MKKFVSMAMAAMMVVSMVPATAFAYEVESTTKILDCAEMTKSEAKTAKTSGISAVAEVPELQIKVSDAAYTSNDTDPEYKFDLKLSNAKWTSLSAEDLAGKVVIAFDKNSPCKNFVKDVNYTVTAEDIDENEVTFAIKGKDGSVLKLTEDDKIVVAMDALLTKSNEGAEAKVSVDSDDLGLDVKDLVFAAVQDSVLTIEVDDMVDMAVEEFVVLEEVVVDAKTGNLPDLIDKKIENSDGVEKEYDLKLKLSKGFEFDVDACEDMVDPYVFRVVAVDGDTAYVNVVGSQEKIEINGLKIEATTAAVGDVATLTVSANDWEKASVDVAKVVGDGLVISVDEDEDVPEMWSGVAVTNSFLTEDDDNQALTFTIKETVAGAHDKKDEIELVLPEGVYVVAANASEVEGNYYVEDDVEQDNEWNTLFANAYKEGEHKSFIFEKRAINESKDEAMEVDVDLTLVADPGFVGDVTVEMLVDGESQGEVTIAKFKAPVAVEAQQNDLKIDYRYTEIPTDIVVKEAEAGLWKKGATFAFDIEKFMTFEDDMEYTVNEESGMEIDGEDKVLSFEVDEESDEEAAVVTISNLSLYMERNIPAGAYDLIFDADMFAEFEDQDLFAPKHKDVDGECTKDCEAEVADVCDFSNTAKEGFVNVITAGREQDDASFTTKVVVPVGESYIVAGESQITLDVPAYVSDAGYTMLPVRAVATALGINNNNVLWDQSSRTVTILYGQRIITMQVGAKVVHVNGSAIPASASVEVVDGRTFLPMRDLATALGVTDITWDGATKTATLNGNI